MHVFININACTINMPRRWLWGEFGFSLNTLEVGCVRAWTPKSCHPESDVIILRGLLPGRSHQVWLKDAQGDHQGAHPFLPPCGAVAIHHASISLFGASEPSVRAEPEVLMQEVDAVGWELSLIQLPSELLIPTQIPSVSDEYKYCRLLLKHLWTDCENDEWSSRWTDKIFAVWNYQQPLNLPQ